MKFSHPYLLNLLWALFPVAAILVYGLLRRKKILNAFADTGMLALIAPGYHSGRRWLKISLILIALSFAILALAGPQAGFHWEKVKQQGVDIMIALDCSKSMLAQDIKPNRLERAKREILDLLKMMKSDRAGLVAFSGKAVLQCPLTLDHQAFNIFLKVLEPDFLPVGGTNLDAAIQACYSGFEKKSDTQKAIILITDGQPTSGDTQKIVQQMAKEDIKIFCIGVGSLEGAPIPDDAGGFKKDHSGTIVLSKVDETGLQKIADITGGAYVRSVAGDMDLDLIYTDKIQGTMEKKTLVSGRKKVWENRYQWVLFPCLVLLLLEFFISPFTRSKGMVCLLAASLVFFQGAPGYARSVSGSVKQGIQAFETGDYEAAQKAFIDAQLENPDDFRLYYNIGAAAYMAKNFDLAQKNFAQAVKSPDAVLKHNARYNLANTWFQQGRLDEAIKGYEQILKDHPEDTQAKENLEFAKKKKQEEQQSKPDSNSQDKDSKHQDSKDNKDKKDPKEKKDSDASEKDSSENNKDQQEQNQNKADNKETDQGKENQQSGQQPEPGESDPAQDKDSGPPPEPKPEQTKETDPDSRKNQGRAAAGKETPGEKADPAMESKLNRLEDKPGQAMIPVGQGQTNGKDW